MSVPKQVLKTIQECKTADKMPRRQIITMMNGLGFERKDSGDHMVFRHPQGYRLVIPYKKDTIDIRRFYLKEVRNLLTKMEEKGEIPKMEETMALPKYKTVGAQNQDPTAMEIVWQGRRDGKTLAQIAEALDRAGYRTATGLRFTYSAVNTVILAPWYQQFAKAKGGEFKKTIKDGAIGGPVVTYKDPEIVQKPPKVPILEKTPEPVKLPDEPKLAEKISLQQVLDTQAQILEVLETLKTEITSTQDLLLDVTQKIEQPKSKKDEQTNQRVAKIKQAISEHPAFKDNLQVLAAITGIGLATIKKYKEKGLI